MKDKYIQVRVSESEKEKLKKMANGNMSKFVIRSAMMINHYREAYKRYTELFTELVKSNGIISDKKRLLMLADKILGDNTLYEMLDGDV